MKKVSHMVPVILVSAFCIASFVLNGYGQSDPLLEIEKKIEKAPTPEKREAITKIRDVYREIKQNSIVLNIADLILKADRNIQVLESLAEYGIRQGGGTPLYMSLAEQAAKAPLADKEFLRLAEIFKKQDSGYNFQTIPKLGEEAAQAKTEAELKIVRDKIAILESKLPGAPPSVREITYDENKVKPYVAWLQSNAKPPVDYIFDLFKTYDIVFIAERMHPETTQWDFIYELTSDPRFIENVGNIFTEYGSVSQQPELEKFMNTPLSPEDRDKAVVHLLQNFPIWPIGWTNNNIYDYLRKLYTLNQQLEPQRRISLFFSDIPWEWEGITKKEYEERDKTVLVRRDEIMADRVAKKFKEIQASGSPRKKALVIMNTRHGFGELYRNGELRPNACGYLMKQCPGRVANVMMNYIESDAEKIEPGKKPDGNIADSSANNRSGNEKRSDTVLNVSQQEGWLATERLAQDGIWDAAFGLMGNKPLGFSFKGSPFGKDTFDYIAPIYSMFKYQDVFTGIVFYQPLDLHMIENSIPGYFDPVFQRILLERAKVLGDQYANNLQSAFEKKAKIGDDKRSAYNKKLVFKPKQ